jgi:hypothetical protein
MHGAKRKLQRGEAGSATTYLDEACLKDMLAQHHPIGCSRSSDLATGGGIGYNLFGLTQGAVCKF